MRRARRIAVGAVINLDNARQWLGRVDVRADHAGPGRLAALFATLDRDDVAPGVGQALPPLGHWLYFVRPERQSEIGEDGRARGAFLPPIELPRRAWAASRLTFHRSLRVGDPISRVSSIVDIAETDDRHGPRVWLLLRDEIADDRGVAVSEERRLVFSDRSDRPWREAPRLARKAPLWSRHVRADERTLFRYAALTFDASRIHYDRPYATFVEGHPGLVVQGGLVANLLLDLLHRHAPEARVTGCDVHVIRPLFDVEPFCLHGRPLDGQTAELWAEDARGALAMEATATLHGTSWPAVTKGGQR